MLNDSPPAAGRLSDIILYISTKNGGKSRHFQTVDKALLLQGFAIVGTAFLI